jgi:hypothetical protein
MKTIKELKIEEYDRLLASIKHCIDRPAMYGMPEDVRLIGKNWTYLCFSILYPSWTWEETQKKWEGLPQIENLDDEYVEVYYETAEYRKKKWGENEKKAMDIVIEVHTNLWHEFGDRRLPYTKRWNEKLISTPSFLSSIGTPDSVDTLLYFLIGPSLDAYRRECKKKIVHTARGLRDLLVQPDWVRKGIYASETLPFFNNATSNLSILLDELVKLRDQLEADTDSND